MKLEENIKLVSVLKKEQKEKQAQYYKEFKKKHPDYYKEKNAKLRLENFERSLLYQAKSFAKKHELEFVITIKDIIIPELCPLTETEITKSVGEGRVMSNPYVYRINELLGYTKENVIITCVLANHLRLCTSKAQAIAYAKNIKKMFG